MKIKAQRVPCPCCGAPRRGWKFRGEDLRAAREAAGLSLRELARRIELSPAYLSDLELDRRNITAAVVAKYEEHT